MIDQSDWENCQGMQQTTLSLTFNVEILLQLKSGLNKHRRRQPERHCFQSDITQNGQLSLSVARTK
jgi:hypothetical protein